MSTDAASLLTADIADYADGEEGLDDGVCFRVFPSIRAIRDIRGEKKWEFGIFDRGLRGWGRRGSMMCGSGSSLPSALSATSAVKRRGGSGFLTADIADVADVADVADGEEGLDDGVWFRVFPSIRAIRDIRGEKKGEFRIFDRGYRGFRG